MSAGLFVLAIAGNGAQDAADCIATIKGNNSLTQYLSNELSVLLDGRAQKRKRFTHCNT